MQGTGRRQRRGGVKLIGAAGRRRGEQMKRGSGESGERKGEQRTSVAIFSNWLGGNFI